MSKNNDRDLSHGKNIAKIIAWTGILITIIPGMTIRNDYSTIWVAAGMIVTMAGTFFLVSASRSH